MKSQQRGPLLTGLGPPTFPAPPPPSPLCSGSHMGLSRGVRRKPRWREEQGERARQNTGGEMKVPPGIQWRQSLELVETRRNGRLPPSFPGGIGQRELGGPSQAGRR